MVRSRDPRAIGCRWRRTTVSTRPFERRSSNDDDRWRTPDMNTGPGQGAHGPSSLPNWWPADPRLTTSSTSDVVSTCIRNYWLFQCRAHVFLGRSWSVLSKYRQVHNLFRETEYTSTMRLLICIFLVVLLVLMHFCLYFGMFRIRSHNYYRALKDMRVCIVNVIDAAQINQIKYIFMTFCIFFFL